MNINYPRTFFAVMAAVLFTCMPAQAAEVANAANVRHLSGEIEKVDVKLGLIQLRSNLSPGFDEVKDYRINKNDTRVTDPLDKKFLTIDDLQAGQYVVIDVDNGQEDKVVKKITAQPFLAPGLEQAFGDLEAIDAAAGTFVLKERPKAEEMEESSLSYFVYEPKDIIIMQDPNVEPGQVVLKPGDLIRVVYTVSDGKKRAQSMTLYTPEITKTTVTTTTTTVQQ